MPGFCAIAILAFSLILLQASFAGDVGVRSRESFNASWRFARFGPLAGRSTRPEPGAERWSIVASASSEEASKGNVAENAFDGDQATRWCASSGSTDEWLVLDLGRDRQIGRIVVDWEFPDLTYGSAIEVSPDGKVWTPFAPGAARLVRIRATKLPDAKWASIREVKLFDPDGQAIGNERVAGSRSPSAVEFDDSAWRTLDIPHDWGIEGPFRDDLPGDTGKLPWKGIGWYRKHFTVPAGDQGKRIFIDFDGAMANAKVWLNGQYVGTWPYGYQAFRLELTPHVNFGSENVLAVRLDTARLGLAVVSRRGALSQRVAREDSAGACGALGCLRDHAVDYRRERHRPDCRGGRQPKQGERERLGPDGNPRARAGWIGRCASRHHSPPRSRCRGRGLRRGRFDCGRCESKAMGPCHAKPLSRTNHHPARRADRR